MNFEMTEENDQKTRYKIALENLRYQGQLLWTIMGIFLIAQSVILQSILGDFSSINSFWGSVIGMLLSIMWILIFHRNMDLFILRMAQAKDVEPPDWNLLNGAGENFSNGKQVNIGGKPYHMSLLGNIIRTQKFSWFIYLFLFVYLAIFIWNLLYMTQDVHQAFYPFFVVIKQPENHYFR